MNSFEEEEEEKQQEEEEEENNFILNWANPVMGLMGHH